MSHIVEIQNPKSVTFQVRWGKQGKGETATFNSSLLNEEEARKCAEKFKNRIDKEFPKQPKNIKRQINNKSGITGMRLSWGKQKSGERYPYISGNYTDEKGKTRMYGFSIEQHGLEGAICKALKKRAIGGKPVPTIEECMKVFLPQYKITGV
jgi:hypothetical protein